RRCCAPRTPRARPRPRQARPPTLLPRRASAPPANASHKEKAMDDHDYGTVPEPRILRIERLLPGPVERVWGYLTDPDKPAKWLAGGAMELRVGDRAELTFRHADLSPEKTPPEPFRSMEGGHTLNCRITACDPPRLIAYTWGEDWGEVTFELRPR